MIAQANRKVMVFVGDQPHQMDGLGTAQKPFYQLVRHEIRDVLELAMKATSIRDFYVGCAPGGEIIFAEEVLALKKDFPEVRLIIAAPCEEQEKQWSEAVQRRYWEIANQADDTVCVTTGPFEPAKVGERNRWVIDRADIVFAMFGGGGETDTGQAVDYALQKGIRLIHLVPDQIRKKLEAPEDNSPAVKLVS